MENKKWGQYLRKSKTLLVEDGGGQGLEMRLFSNQELHPVGEGIYLLHEIYQLRSIALPFEEVALDIIEWTERPVVYSSYPSKMLEDAKNPDALIKFAFIKEQFWKDFLFSAGQIVLCQKKINTTPQFKTDQLFPWTTSKATEMFLGPDGEVKIWNE
ncbi:hypothetical protein [Pleomorphovibrio marinus]|uniref:hypothetical protein n=1 Tax=Pleomorphovibrio marinus TaxID=2164132 RepID=UPI0013002FEE|nr:hypothetical protein [Pleomorphovibrio marinus]